MSKKLYYIIITIAFAIVSISTLLTIISNDLIPNINSNLCKTFLVFFICGHEINYIKNKVANIIGWFFLVLLFIGLQFRIMHWPFGIEMIITSGVVITATLVLSSIIEKNKEVIHFFLFAFVAQRLVIILTPPNKILWWIDVILGLSILILGIRQIVKSKTPEEKLL